MIVAMLLVTLIVLAQPFVFQSPTEIPKINADLLISLTGAALSILAYIIPPFRRLQERAGDWTPAYMAGALFLVAIAYQAVWCAYDMACVVANWQGVLTVWGLAVATNYGAYKATIKPAKDRVKKETAAAAAAELIYFDDPQ